MKVPRTGKALTPWSLRRCLCPEEVNALFHRRLDHGEVIALQQDRFDIQPPLSCHLGRMLTRKVHMRPGLMAVVQPRRTLEARRV